MSDHTLARRDAGNVEPIPDLGPAFESPRHLYVFGETDPVDAQDRLESLALAMPDMMFRLDSLGRLTEALPAVDEPFAMSPAEFLGKHYSEVLPPPATRHLELAMGRVSEGDVVEFDYEMSGPTGVGQYSARMLSVPGGEWVVTVRNITALRHAQWDLAMFFEMSPDLPVISTTTGRFLRVNGRAWKDVLGWDERELLSRPYIDFIHPDDREATAAVAARLAEGHHLIGFTNRYRTKAGGYRWLEWRARLVPDTETLIAVARDVTEQRAADRRASLLAGISTAVQLSGADTESLVASIAGAVADALATSCDLVLAGDPESADLGPFRQAIVVGGKTVAELRIGATGRDDLSDQERALLRDVADRLAPLVANIRIRRHLNEAAELIDAADSGVASLSLDGVVKTWNRAAERITGIPPKAAIGHNIQSVLAIEEGHQSQTAFRSASIDGGTFHYESRWQRSDQTIVWVDVSVAPVMRETSDPQAVVMTFIDITERKDMQAQLASVSRVDALTDLPNRGELGRVLDEALSKATARHPGSLLFIDIDGFRRLNEKHGQTLGDQLLREVADRLRGIDLPDAAVGRLSSDEFGVIIPPGALSTPDGDVRLAGHILDQVNQPVTLGGNELRLSASCGIARFPHDGLTGDELLWRAEAAMEAARTHGGGHAERFRKGMQPSGTRMAKQARRIRRGIERDEFILHYQPLVSAVDGRVVAYEALARWQAGKRLHSPAEFLETAEASGAIIPLGYQLIDIGCRWLASKPASPRIDLWLNLSRRQFAAEDLPCRLDRQLRELDVDPGRVTLEITETTLFHDVDQAKQTLAAVKELGVRVALDDFGVGQSSLGSLMELPVDAIKIDRDFVGGLDDPSTPGRLAIVRAAIDMGHALGLQVTAEGVEREEERAILVELGCDLLQGYLFGRPQADPPWPRPSHSLPHARSVPPEAGLPAPRTA